MQKPVEERNGTDHPMDEAVPSEATTILRARPTLAKVGGDSEAPRGAPVPKTIVPETRLAAISATETMRAKSIITINNFVDGGLAGSPGSKVDSPRDKPSSGLGDQNDKDNQHSAAYSRERSLHHPGLQLC